ncbi:MAG: TolC family protein, partial [Elusimicrobia bacterium]|nr:TolC family protein [Elusimicrobiota bacterium]
AARERAEAELRAARLGTSAELRAAWVRTRTAGRLADAYRRSLVPQAEAALRVAETGYQAGDNGFLDLLDAQRSLLDDRLEYFQYLDGYEESLAELERASGQELRKP